ncbi:hypothetical protein Tsubulata_041714, partial [Turnera subulata]
MMLDKDFLTARKVVLRAQKLYEELDNISKMLVVCEQTRHPPAQKGFSNAQWTFLTACPSCFIVCQYFIGIVNKPVLCPSCRKPFIAYESVRNVNQQPSHQKMDVPDQDGCKVETTATVRNVNQPPFHQKMDVPVKGDCTVEQTTAVRNVNQPSFHHKMDAPDQGSCKSRTRPVEVNFTAEHLNTENAKRKRVIVEEEEPSESCDSVSSNEPDGTMDVDEDGDFEVNQNPGYKAECPTRSYRSKQKVSYKENIDVESIGFVNSPKQEHKLASPPATENLTGNRMDENTLKMRKIFAADAKNQNEVKRKETLDSIEEIKENVSRNEKAEENGNADVGQFQTDHLYKFPVSEFSDFDTGRNERCFQEGQIWALYDCLDGMPRFYAQVKKVFPSCFKLQITWLEVCPDDEKEREWVNEDLPTSCGRFTFGENECTEKLSMFSHQACWERDKQRNKIKIFPRKGETWALFKNWGIKLLKADLDADGKFEYEFVEVLSDFTEDIGAYVAYLGKVKGFVSLFCRTSKEGKDRFQIPPNELFRFAHRLPSFKLMGAEREDVPKGCFEFDPACLPISIKEIVSPEDIRLEVDDNEANGSCFRSPDNLEPKLVPRSKASIHQIDAASNLSEGISIPESQFSNFDEEKFVKKFQAGQIWSLYCDEDGLPKYYGKITKVFDRRKGFRLNLRWLESKTSMLDDQIPISCGNFKIQSGRPTTYTSVDPFSHQVTSVCAVGEDEYRILPGEGEVWALYRHWSANMTVADLWDCEYDVVEVMEENDLHIKVLVLERVNGYKAVFKAQVKEGCSVTNTISCRDLFKFSHKIPSFRLEDKRHGNLRGFWEIDLAAMPEHYF